MTAIDYRRITHRNWQHVLAVFFAGVFLANFVPHFVSGISGNSFPSPFADPPGFGNSSPLANVLWGSANLAVGYGLLRYGRLSATNGRAVVVLFFGFVAMAVVLSQGFSHRA